MDKIEKVLIVKKKKQPCEKVKKEKKEKKMKKEENGEEWIIKQKNQPCEQIKKERKPAMKKKKPCVKLSFYDWECKPIFSNFFECKSQTNLNCPYWLLPNNARLMYLCYHHDGNEHCKFCPPIQNKEEDNGKQPTEATIIAESNA